MAQIWTQPSANHARNNELTANTAKRSSGVRERQFLSNSDFNELRNRNSMGSYTVGSLRVRCQPTGSYFRLANNTE